jgi:hypothetical protein
LDALGQTEKIVSVRAIEPLTATKVYLENPDSKSIHGLDGNNGILIWLDHYPWPLRIEFKNEVVVKKWGMSNKCLASETRMRMDCSSINRLADTINIGASRVMVYSAILNFKTNLSKQVGNFVVGLQDFRDGKNNSQIAYKELLMSNDVWQFEGLKELSKYKNPFYSRVTLYFHDGRLTKIKHWSAPYEMP